MALVHTEEAVVWAKEAMEGLVAVVVQPMEESMDSVREEKTDVREVVLEAAEVRQALVVPAVVVLLEEVAAEDSAHLEEVEKSEAEVIQALVVQAAVVLQEEASAPVEGMEVMQLQAVG